VYVLFVSHAKQKVEKIDEIIQASINQSINALVLKFFKCQDVQLTFPTCKFIYIHALIEKLRNVPIAWKLSCNFYLPRYIATEIENGVQR
jgi:hypothetical protein